MLPSNTRNRVYTIAFLTILFILIPFVLGGITGVGIVLGFVLVVGFVRWFVEQIWRIPLLSHFQALHPTLSNIIKFVLLILILVTPILIFLGLLAQNGPWLPTAS